MFAELTSWVLRDTARCLILLQLLDTIALATMSRIGERKLMESWLGGVAMTYWVVGSFGVVVFPILVYAQALRTLNDRSGNPLWSLIASLGLAVVGFMACAPIYH